MDSGATSVRITAMARSRRVEKQSQAALQGLWISDCNEEGGNGPTTGTGRRRGRAANGDRLTTGTGQRRGQADVGMADGREKSAKLMEHSWTGG